MRTNQRQRKIVISFRHDTMLSMFRSKWIKTLLVFITLVGLSILLYQIPWINQRLAWRLDIAQTYIRGVIHPASAVPTPEASADLPLHALEPTSTPTHHPTPTPAPLPTGQPSSTPTITLTETPTSTPIPDLVELPVFGWEQQGMNNCGPAALSMYLHYYGWEGDQFDIASIVKTFPNDRNVNIEELDYFVRNYAGWLNTIYRVGGDLELLKNLIADEIPVLIETSFYFDGAYWPNDDLWAAHYLLVTGYDESAGTFTVQDTFHGPDQVLDFATLDEYWQPFNRVYTLIYLPVQEESVKSILGSDWDDAVNRQHALETARAEIDADPQDGYAWFNLGTNLLYFERYEEAAAAYDQARSIGWPQRMLRYQFGPFLAYFHAGRIEDLLVLTEYALQRTFNSEEALLWHGWALYRMGDINGAVADFQAALEKNNTYVDAQYALDFVLNP